MVIRLVPLGRGDQGQAGSDIVADAGEVRMLSDGNSIFLIVGDDFPLGRLEPGDIVRWSATPLRVAWLAEQRSLDQSHEGPKGFQHDSEEG